MFQGPATQMKGPPLPKLTPQRKWRDLLGLFYYTYMGNGCKFGVQRSSPVFDPITPYLLCIFLLLISTMIWGAPVLLYKFQWVPYSENRDRGGSVSLAIFDSYFIWFSHSRALFGLHHSLKLRAASKKVTGFQVHRPETVSSETLLWSSTGWTTRLGSFHLFFPSFWSWALPPSSRGKSFQDIGGAIANHVSSFQRISRLSSWCFHRQYIYHFWWNSVACFEFQMRTPGCQQLNRTRPVYTFDIEFYINEWTFSFCNHDY